MNSQLQTVYDHDVSECDRCGDPIHAGEKHYTTKGGELILCLTCAANTKET